MKASLSRDWRSLCLMMGRTLTLAISPEPDLEELLQALKDILRRWTFLTAREAVHSGLSPRHVLKGLEGIDPVDQLMKRK